MNSNEDKINVLPVSSAEPTCWLLWSAHSNKVTSSCAVAIVSIAESKNKKKKRLEKSLWYFDQFMTAPRTRWHLGCWKLANCHEFDLPEQQTTFIYTEGCLRRWRYRVGVLAHLAEVARSIRLTIPRRGAADRSGSNFVKGWLSWKTTQKVVFEQYDSLRNKLRSKNKDDS